MTRNLCMYLFMLLAFHAASAQTLTGKIVDAESNESLPYANIEVNGENIVSNSEGSFTLPTKSTADDAVLTISFLGYHSARVSVSQLKSEQLTIKLNPGYFELDTVNISNAKPDVDSIMVNVKRNLDRNYLRNSGSAAKYFIFYREGITFKPSKLKVEINKSTGYSKEGLKATNKQLTAFTSDLLSHPPQEFTEMLCNYYTAIKTVNNKPGFYTKFNVVKGIKLKDKNRAVSLNEMQEMATGILFQHLDSTKYYRIKSGLFGSRDTIRLGSNNKKHSDKKQSMRRQAQSEVTSFMSGNSFMTSSLDFVSHYELYNYTFEGLVPSGNQYVYVLKFFPKKSKAKYTGTLYISDNDYAVVKADYALAEGKTLGGVNLKFLLGVKQSENLSKGTLIFKERKSGSGYYLQYGSITSGQYVYVNRPLKFIEMSDEEKDVVAFDLKLETNILSKTEYYNMEQDEISDAAFEDVKETEFSYVHLNSYDPKIWKEYSAIEPLEEMKQFKAVE